MVIKASRGADLTWESSDHKGNVWFKSQISIYDFSALETTDQAASDYLQKLLKNTVRLNCEFLDKWNSFKIETKLDFPADWGLGSSSTLIYLIAMWADVHPMELYFKTENGSGYDVACAGAKGPIEYWSTDDEISYTGIDFKPSFANNLYFVHLNKKANSGDAIKTYLKSKGNKSTFVEKITALSDQIQEVKTLSEFQAIIDEHENLVSKQLDLKKAKDLHFSDYWGSVKSLGAWGGDFVLVTSEASEAETKKYFADKGFETFLTYKQLIL